MPIFFVILCHFIALHDSSTCVKLATYKSCLSISVKNVILFTYLNPRMTIITANCVMTTKLIAGFRFQFVIIVGGNNLNYCNCQYQLAIQHYQYQIAVKLLQDCGNH